VMVVIALIAAILAPIMAQLLYFALSRRREYLADAGAVRLTRYPEGLASALEKIAGDRTPLESANKVTAPMYISLPFKGRKAAHLHSTHPPIEERIRILRNMSRGASFKDYSDAYSQTVGGASVIPASAVKGAGQVELRQASAESRREEGRRKQERQMGDIMRKVSGFEFLTCACGIKMKVPPNFKGDQVKCPRCGRISSVHG